MEVLNGPDTVDLAMSFFEIAPPAKAKELVVFEFRWKEIEITDNRRRGSRCTKTMAVEVSALKQGTDRGRPVLEITGYALFLDREIQILYNPDTKKGVAITGAF